MTLEDKLHWIERGKAVRMKTAQEALIGYMARIDSESRRMSTGGLLVANRRGIPIEFRYTAPVEMSEPRYLLYEDDESRMAAVSLTIAASLWKSLRQKPPIVLMEEFSSTRLWERVSKSGMIIAVHISRAKPRGMSAKAFPDGDDGSIYIQAVPPSDAALDLASAQLTLAAKEMRIDEPFERVERILQSLHNLPESEKRARESTDEAPAPAGIAKRPDLEWLQR